MMNRWMTRMQQLAKDDEGIGTLEVILIVAVIVIIAVAFRKWIIAWVQQLFNSSNDELKQTNQNSIVVPGP